MMMKRMIRMLDSLTEMSVEFDSSNENFHVRTSRMRTLRIRIDDLIERHTDEMTKFMN